MLLQSFGKRPGGYTGGLSLSTVRAGPPTVSRAFQNSTKGLSTHFAIQRIRDLLLIIIFITICKISDPETGVLVRIGIRIYQRKIMYCIIIAGMNIRESDPFTKVVMK